MNAPPPPSPTPRLTTTPGIGGTIRHRHDDFLVQEIPAYEPSGSGEHTFFEIEKTGIDTFAAIDLIAKALDIRPRNIGYAGLKDAQAITRQRLSVQLIDPEQVRAIDVPGKLKVLWVDRHANKLRRSHLKGNRFAIRIRDVEPTAVVRVKSMLETLERVGLPNFFGEQRFGMRGDNAELAAAFVSGDDTRLLQLLLGNGRPELDSPTQLAARQAYDAGDLALAHRTWPHHSRLELKLLHGLLRGIPAATLARQIEPRLTELWVNALQSRLFNDVVADRLDALATMLPGDLAYIHESEKVFAVEDADEVAPRVTSFELSPSGPMLGSRMLQPTGEPLAIEQAVMERYCLRDRDALASKRLEVSGSRRPLRVPVTQPQCSGGVDEHGPFVLVAFTLPAGSFATTLLREIMGEVTDAKRPGGGRESSDRR